MTGIMKPLNHEISWLQLTYYRNNTYISALLDLNFEQFFSNLSFLVLNLKDFFDILL